MTQQAAVASQTASEGSVSKLAQFFPEAVAVRIPVRVTGTGGRGRELSEQTLIEYGTADEVLFASSLPLEFDDSLQLENADGSLRAQASIVALNRVLYVKGQFGSSKKLDLAAVTKIDFK